MPITHAPPVIEPPSQYRSPSMAAVLPHTPSPPSSPPEVKTPLRSGGSVHPWEAYHNHHHPNHNPYSNNQHLSYSPFTPRVPYPQASTQQSPSRYSPNKPSAQASQQSPLAPPSHSLPPPQPPAISNLSQSSAPVTTSPLSAPPLFLKQELESEAWHTLYPSEIASFSPTTLRAKLSHSNSLLTRLSSSLSEARAQAAHYTFQHQLLTIETEEATQRHQVEHDISKREVEVLRGVGGATGAGGLMEQQRYCWALEEELAAYKRKLRRTKALLREAREEVVEVKGENDKLKWRIAQNRVQRMRDFEVDLPPGIAASQNGPGPEEYSYDDATTYAEEIGAGTGYREDHSSSGGPPTPRASCVQKPHHHHHHHHHHNHQQQPTPQHSSSAGNPNLLSSPPPHQHQHHYPARFPQTSPNHATEEDALTTLGMLASRVLSQEGFSEPQTPLTSSATQFTTRATTPVRGIPATTIPSTPLSQARNHPGPTRNVARTPKTPAGRGGRAQAPRAANAVSTPSRKQKTAAAAATAAAALIATPKYTSPLTAPQQQQQQQYIQHKTYHTQPPLSSSPPQLPPSHAHAQPQPRGKKRRLSSDSTLSATRGPSSSSSSSSASAFSSSSPELLAAQAPGPEGGQDEEEREELEFLVRTGSPVARVRKRGKVIGGSGYVPVVGGGAGAGAQGGRWNKRSRRMVGGE